MNRIRVLVVDDSPLVRDIIIAILSTDPEIEIAGQAVDGRDAINKVKVLKPDIVTMDIEMPVMDGLSAIENIMAHSAVPILVVTSKGDAKMAYAAISKGALDLVMKPEVNIAASHEFISKVKLLSRIKVITHLKGKLPIRDRTAPTSPQMGKAGANGRIVAIAASTGGPDAVSVILSGLPGDLPCPVVIAQHISEGFVTGMVEWLRTISKLDIRVASDKEALCPGTVYVSPPEKHLEIETAGKICLIDRNPKDIYRPSCDVLLSSAAAAYGKKSIGVILTGMGSDGVAGIRKIKEAGGKTIAQDERTSVVFGMPKLAIESGAIDKVLPIGEISGEIVKMLGGYFPA